MENNNRGTVKWIVGLCVAAVLAIAGWTVTFTQVAKARAYETIITDAVNLKNMVTQDTIRIAVLESKYDSIETTLERIEGLLQAHIGK